MSRLGLGILVLLAGLLMLGIMGAGSASFPQKLLEGWFGEVTAVTEMPDRAAIMVNTGEGELQFFASPDARVRAPGQPEKQSVGDLVAGDRVAVLAVSDGEAYRQAINILVRPNQAVSTRHFVGVVIAVEDDGALVVQDKEGTQISLAPRPGMPPVSPGEAITVTLAQDAPSGRLVAVGIEKAETSMARLQKALEKAEQAGDRSTVQSLLARMDRFATGHLTLLQRVSQQSPPQAREHVLSRLEIQKQSYQPLLARYGLGPPSAQVEGVISVVDPAARRIVVQPQGLDSVEVQVPPESNVITLGGQQMGFDRLEVGRQVSVLYQLADGVATRLQVSSGPSLDAEVASRLLVSSRGAEVTGRVASIHANGQPPQVVITEEDSGRPVTLRVSPKSLIGPNREPGTPGLALFQADDQVTASFDPETLDVVELSPIVAPPGETALRGVVRSFVAKPGIKGNFTVYTEDGQSLELSHGRSTPIVRDGRRVPINEVRLGDIVRPNSRYNAGSGELAFLSLRSPLPVTTSGTVQGVSVNSTGKARVTISDSRLNLVSLMLTSQTAVVDRGEPVGADAIGVGQKARWVTYNPISGEASRLDLVLATTLN